MFQKLIDLDHGTINEISHSVAFLMKCMKRYYHKNVMLFIDEYDAPFMSAYTKGFYNEVHDGLSALLLQSLKLSDDLQYALMTGIQRVAKENIFSKLNNIKVYTVKDKKFSQYFGFTPEETETLLNYYGLKLNDEVKAKYDGYHMGDYEIYNPWSILNYADDKELNAYWVHTSANTMIKDSISKNTSMNYTNSFKENYEKLITQGYLETIVRLETSFYEQADEASLWGLFVNAGYLTITEIKDDDDYVIRIPNDEVKSEFQSLTAYQLNLSENLFHDSLIKENSEKYIRTYQLMFQ